jgi:hypothetical protein
MLDVDTFLTTLYVLVDEECKAQQAAQTPAASLRSWPPGRPPGRPPKLTPSEVITLGLFAQWRFFGSERAFYRYAQRHLRAAFPTLPNRSQYNRLLRRQYAGLIAIAWRVAARLGAATCLYQVLDTTGVPTRQYKRRACGWLPSAAGIGYCNRVGWFEGLRLLTCATAEGVLTGFGLGEAPRKDQPLADAFLTARALPSAETTTRLPCVGQWYGGYYAVDTGFEGRALLQHWAEDLEALVVCMPNRSRPSGWPKRLRQWFAGVRQIAETVHARLMDTFGLTTDRPHSLEGFQVRLAAKLALYNCCCWFNQQAGRPLLAFADLLDW